MKFDQDGPFCNPRGTYKGCDLVFSQVRGKTVARKKVKPANPQTPDQVKVRSYMTAATRFLSTISRGQFAQWHLYAMTHCQEWDPEYPMRDLAMRTFVQANLMREIMELPMIADAPQLAPPGKPLAISQAEAPSADSVALTIRHDLPDPRGYVVAVRATAAMRTLACTPRKDHMRYVCGVSPESVQPLPPSGGTVVFTGAKYAVSHGQRYGVEVKIVRASDGTASPSVFADFIKAVAPAPGSDAETTEPALTYTEENNENE